MAFAAAVLPKRRFSTIVAAVVVFAAAVALAAPAQAAFPGANGKIAFTRGCDVWVANPDGSQSVNLTADPSSPTCEQDPAWSPDGSKIAFTSDYRFSGSNARDVYVMRSDGSDVSRVTRLSPSSPCALGPAWSPTGQQIVFTNTCAFNTQLYVVNLDGNGLRELTPGDDSLEESAAWSPDGSKIAFVRSSEQQIYTVNPDGTGLAKLTNATAASSRAPNWSPDGSRLAFARTCTGGCGNGNIYTMGSDGTDERQVTSSDARESSPAWSPDGSAIVFVSCVFQNNACPTDLHVVPASGGGSTPITTGPSDDRAPDWGVVSPPKPASPPLAGPNGLIAFASTRDHLYDGLDSEGSKEIYVMNPDGTSVRRLTFNRGADLNPDWSPDGSKIAFTSTRDSNYEIYVMNADGSGQTNLTQSGGDETDPSWSPDGSKIAFAYAPVPWEQPALFTMNPDGSNRTRLTSPVGSDVAPAWSPDGTQIAFATNRESALHGWEIYTVTADGAVLRNLSNSSENESYRSSWSPDGRQLAFSRYGTSGTADVWKMNSDGALQTKIKDGAVEPAWSPDGQTILFTAWEPVTAAHDVFSMRADGGGVVNLTNSEGYDSDAAWQTLPHPYPRPNGAAKVRVTLVPAFEQCSSSGSQSNHGPPLSLASCNPARQASAFASVPNDDSTTANGSVVFKYRCTNGGAPVDCGATGDQADVATTVSFRDVRRALATEQEYGGELQARVRLRITDRNNRFGHTAATVSDAELNVTVPCAATPSDPAGSTCTVNTTLDTVMPGLVREDTRAVWELGEIELYDGGADGQALTTADNTPFAVEGIFIP